MSDDMVVGHGEFRPYPVSRPALSAFPASSGFPNGAVSFEHAAAQVRARGGGSNQKCEHGYWIHAHDPCPHCWGVHPGRNDDVVPHQGEGNGWMLRKGQPACLVCGGPANAGFGLIPSGMTPEQLAAEMARPKKCYGCTLKNPDPLQAGDKPGWKHVVNGLARKTRSGPTVPPFTPGKERF